MRYLFVIDPIDTLVSDHDTSIILMKSVQELMGEVWVCECKHLYTENGNAFCFANHIDVGVGQSDWYRKIEESTVNCAEFDVIMMRKDPPFNMNYVFTTYILDIAAKAGVLVVNRPSSLRNFNEKLILNHFPELTTNYLVTSDVGRLGLFIDKYKDVVVKKLDSMGGEGVHRLYSKDNNNDALNSLTSNQRTCIMIMEYIPEIVQGDKRILLLNGKPLSHALLRIPPEGQLQANIAAGGVGKVVPLERKDIEICNAISPFCIEHGLYIVGIDIIGDFVTEVNITSPTCLVEIEEYLHENISLQFIDELNAQR